MAADRTNVVIKATDVTGKQVSTTINYANPNAANITLKTMGQMMNALTTNSYIQTNRTDITVLDTAPPTPADKQTPTFTYSPKLTFSKAAAGTSSSPTDDGYKTAQTWFIIQTITYNGDGVLYISPSTPTYSGQVTNNGDGTYTVNYAIGTNDTLPITFTIGATEGSSYKAVAPVTVTFTA